MALVSISQAAKLVGKNRATIYKYLKSGKLSSVGDSGDNRRKIDTSELLRVFGTFKSVASDTMATVEKQHQATPKATQRDNKNDSIFTENQVLKAKIELLEKLLEEKDKRLLLLENKVPEPPQKRKKFLGIF